MQCPNCSSPLVATGDGGTFVCRSCASRSNTSRNGNNGLALVAFNNNDNIENATAAAAAQNNLANLPDPRSTLAAAAEHIEIYLQAKDEAARGENEVLAARAKDAIETHKEKLNKTYAAYTRARSKLIEAARARDEAEQETKELQQKYAVKAK